MPRTFVPPANRVALLVLLGVPASIGFGQYQNDAAIPVEDQQVQASAPLLSPQELDNLVSPVALYPDQLLSQVLSASTYPLEVVEAQQWIQRNNNLQGEQLLEAARQQPWDPSVQALVAFPDVLQALSSNVRWTTDLGNAFLAQEADVMNAVQRMRARARDNGRLSTNQQQVVSMEDDAILIQPADPAVVYVPYYDPMYVWGAPAWGYYPSFWYPSGFGFGFGFGRGIFMSAFFPRWGGWSNWGWGCNWRSRGLFFNRDFYGRHGFRNGYAGYGGGFGRSFGGGRVGWFHDPSHRRSVPYPNRALSTRFQSGRFNSGFGRRYDGNGSLNRSFDGGRSQRRQPGFGQAGPRSSFNGDRSGSGGQNWRRFGRDGSNPRGRSDSGVNGSIQRDRGFAGTSGRRSIERRSDTSNSFTPPARSFSPPSADGRSRSGFRSFGRQNGRNDSAAPSQNYSAPRSNGRFNGQSSSGSQRFSAPRSRGFDRPPYSAPRSNGRFNGQSFSAPQGFSGPRSRGGFDRPSSPRTQSFSSPRMQSAPRQNFSAPSRGFGGGGFSRGGGNSFGRGNSGNVDGGRGRRR